MSKLPTMLESVSYPATVVIADKVDYDGTSNYFETDQALGDTPTLYMNCLTNTGVPVKNFLMTSLRYYMNPTNAVTYTLHLFEDAQADNTRNLSDLIYQSAAAQVDSQIYEFREGGTGTWAGLTTVDVTLPQIVNLGQTGRLYYLLNWTGAPANTPGYIKIRGRLLI